MKGKRLDKKGQKEAALYSDLVDRCHEDAAYAAARTVVSFKDFLLGKTVYKKSGEKLKIVQVNSAFDIVGQVVFEHDIPLSRIVYHITVLDIDPRSFKQTA